MIARRYFISGRVQGVSFRYYTRQAARELEIAGEVKNLLDGRVEAIAQGDAEKIDEFERFIHSGPSMARVDNVEITELTPDPEKKEFKITY